MFYTSNKYNFFTQEQELNHCSIIGMLSAFSLVIIAIFLGGNLTSFFDFDSMLIVVGGTVGAAFINFSVSDFSNLLNSLKSILFPETQHPQQRIERILSLAERCRREGHLALQNEAVYENDPFLRKALELVADDIKAEQVERILEIELSFHNDQYRKSSQLLQAMGSTAPAMGLIGTLIGLVQMLNQLNNYAAIGPSLALALLTTFYGAMLANLVFLPLAGKMLRQSEEEHLIYEITMEGVLDILNRTHPRLVEQRLSGFISQRERV
ncbi:MAG: MotA/TolQ/ExbB proton channel family protein [Deltaproteobacteria bacterium]|nr:MotA/TolQ/ExbB proton channel family protein [Deltaproteobacteria bacterium]